MADNFYKYFKQNMDAMNLDAPESLFGSLEAAIGTTATIIGVVDKFGKTATVAELVGAGTKYEVLICMGALGAAYYAGAVIGSIAVATGRTLAGGATIADVLLTADQYNLNRHWLPVALVSGR